MKDQQKRGSLSRVSMIVIILLGLAFTQIVAEQAVPDQPKVIRTAPVVVPCLECLKSPGINLASLLRPSAGGAIGPVYHSDTSDTSQPSTQLNPQIDAEDDECCCCCTADDSEQDQNNNVGPSFNVAMLAPLASVLTSFMSKLGNNDNQAVTIDFGGQTCDNSPIEESLPERSRSNLLPCTNVVYNQSASIMPPSPPMAVEASSPAMYNVQSPQRIDAVENRPAFEACQCYKKAYNRWRISDIEEDSLYAYRQSSPEKMYSHNSYINQGTPFNQAFPHNSYSKDSINQHQVQPHRNADFHLQDVKKDSNYLIEPLPTGNSEFDSISKLSALFSSQKNNLNIPSTSYEQSIMPCQCCC